MFSSNTISHMRVPKRLLQEPTGGQSLKISYFSHRFEPPKHLSGTEGGGGGGRGLCLPGALATIKSSSEKDPKGCVVANCGTTKQSAHTITLFSLPALKH